MLVETVVENSILRQNYIVSPRTKIKSNTNHIIGTHPQFLMALEQAKLVSDSMANVFIFGESGTGKDIIAHYIHDEGARSTGPFVAINCSAIPEQLLESELFGHAKGSFTGAIDKRIGLFEEAQNGTLFFDEIGDLSLNMQAKLLRVLQEKKIKRVGENIYRSINCRLIFATHKNLLSLVENQQFREDLYFRINVIQINLPSLRDRKEDIIPLAEYFLKKYSLENNKAHLRFNTEVIDFIKSQPWFGNIRELANAIERSVILSSTDQISLNEFQSLRLHSGKNQIEHYTHQDQWYNELHEKFLLKKDQEILKKYDFENSQVDQLTLFDTDRSTVQSQLLPGLKNDSHKMPQFMFTIPIENQLPSLDQVVLKYIVFAIKKNNGAKDKTAKEIGIDRKTLYKKIKGVDIVRN